MTDTESDYLCSLIDQYKPRKVVEVGVAEGGTTLIILKCLQECSKEALLYSLDYNDDFYRDKSLKTGYLAIEHASEIAPNIKWMRMCGNVAPQYYVVSQGYKDRDILDNCIVETVESVVGELENKTVFLTVQGKAGEEIKTKLLNEIKVREVI